VGIGSALTYGLTVLDWAVAGRLAKQLFPPGHRRPGWSKWFASSFFTLALYLVKYFGREKEDSLAELCKQDQLRPEVGQWVHLCFNLCLIFSLSLSLSLVAFQPSVCHQILVKCIFPRVETKWARIRSDSDNDNGNNNNSTVFLLFRLGTYFCAWA